MANFEPGLVHTPVTPFARDNRIDFDVYGKLIEFHQNRKEGPDLEKVAYGVMRTKWD